MLPIENQPGPSCSCKVSALKSDEKDPEKLAFSEADPTGRGPEHPTHFSIRDYVFASRGKDIGTNWPFSQKNLKLCLKHGVKDLLPPFELPSVVRAKCSEKSERSVQQVSCQEGERTPVEVSLSERKSVCSLNGASDAVDDELCSVSEEPALGSSEPAQIALPGEDKLTAERQGSFDDELTHLEAETKSTVTTFDQIERVPSSISTFLHPIQENKVVSEESSELDVAKVAAFSEKVKNLHESSQKRLRLIVKLGTLSESNRTEDIASNSSVVSDSMASKICPVCKTFSSTSNTTLNAHIDQCLSVDSTTKGAATKLSMNKEKPRMKRSMVDIYATAPRCTLEDLDRRNGTNWSIELNLAAPRNETGNEIKRPKLSPVSPSDDGNEGEVYVDSNGTKLRILSKFSAGPEPAGDNLNHRAHVKEIKEEKRFSFGKKKHMAPEYGKYVKVKLQGKKLSSFKSLKGENRRSYEKEFQADTRHDKEECISPALNTKDQTKNCGSGSLRPWVVSKRSGLPKKFNSKVSCRSPRSLVDFSPNLWAESNQPQSGNSSTVRNNVLKLSKTSDDFTSFPKTKSMDILSNKANTKDFKERASPGSCEIHCHNLPENGFSRSNTASTVNGLMLKLSRSSRNYMTPKTAENFHQSQKAKRKSTRKAAISQRTSYTLEASKNEVDNQVVSKKFEKLGSIQGACKHGRTFANDIIDHLGDSTRDSDLVSVSDNQTNRNYHSHFSDNMKRPELEGVNEKVSPSQWLIKRATQCTKLRHCRVNKKVPPSQQPRLESRKGKESTRIPEREKYSVSKQLQLVAQFQVPELADGDMQVEASSNEDTVTISVDRVVGVPATRKSVTSEDHITALIDKLHMDPCLQEEVNPTGGTEACKEPSGPELYKDTVMHHGNEGNNMVICLNIPSEDQVESRGKSNTCSDFRLMECQMDTASIQGSSACLTGPGDTGTEIPQENSSVTSVRIVPPRDYYVETVRGSSESPVSVASIVSHPPTEDTKHKDLEPEPSTRAVVVQDKQKSEFSHEWALPFMARLDESEKTGIERGHHEVKTIALDQEHKNSRDAHTCCCSRRESTSREYMSLRQSIMGEPKLPVKQMTSNLYSRRAGLDTYPSLRTEETTRPVSESSLDSFSAKSSLDSAGRNSKFSDFGSANIPWIRPQSSPSPILRLMGKNLMVGKDNEESVPPQKVVPCSSSVNPHSTSYLSLMDFSSVGNLSNEDGVQYQHNQFPEGSVTMGQSASKGQQMAEPPPIMMRMGGFMGSSTQNGSNSISDLQVHQKNFNGQTCSTSVENIGTVHQCGKPISSTGVPNMPREVIVIDDSPELETGTLATQRSSMPPTVSGSHIRPIVTHLPNYHPSQNPVSFSELPSETRPVLPISCPRTDFHIVKREILPSPFMVPSFSSGHLPPTLYYNTQRLL